MDRDEAQAVGAVLAFRVRHAELPPDDAYFWTRYVCEALRDLRPTVDPEPLTATMPR